MRCAQWILFFMPSSLVLAFRAIPVVRLSARDSCPTRARVSMSAGQPPMLPPARDRDDDKNDNSSGQMEGLSKAVMGNIMGSNRKITLAFTCKICEDRSAYQISRVAYEEGIVVVWCKGCSQKHLIADNLGKMDFPWFGRNLEEHMAKKGTPVKRVTLTKDGIGSIEARIPGVHSPASGGSGPEGFVAKSILPGDHVGDSILPGVSPTSFNFGGERGGGTEDQASSQESD